MTSVLMGPYATQLLGDLGADVIKVEQPTGDTTRRIGPERSEGMGSNFLNTNRSKRSIVLDLKQPGGREVLLRLAKGSDVFVHNIRKAAMERLCLAYSDLHAVAPRLIYCTLAGFGSGGPYSGLPAYDDLIQGLCALPSLLEQATGVPCYVPAPIVDRAAGLHAAFAVTAALLGRGEGDGQEVELPMFETMAQLILADHLYGCTFDPPLGEPGYTRLLSPHRRPFRTLDGWLCILTYTDRHWRDFFGLIGRHDLLKQERFATMRGRNAAIDDLYSLVSDAVAKRTTAEWMRLLREADIPVAAMNSLDDLIDDPHLAAVGFFTREDHPTEGPIRSMAVPSRWSKTIPGPFRPAPALGADTATILSEAGYGPTEIIALQAAGVTR